MVENTSNDKTKNKGLAPICRFKYLLYTIIDFVIISWGVNEFSKIHNGKLCGIFFTLLNAIIVIPYLMAKRAKDIEQISVKAILGLWYLSLLGIYFIPFLSGLLNIPYLTDFSYNFMLFAIGLQIYLIVAKGKYDTYDIISVITPICKNILFWDYIQNKGIKRLCIIFSIIFSITFFFMFSRWGFKHWNWVIADIEWSNIRNALIGFYIPFVLSAIIQWVYNGFKSNS